MDIAYTPKPSLICCPVVHFPYKFGFPIYFIVPICYNVMTIKTKNANSGGSWDPRSNNKIRLAKTVGLILRY
jgi:hypothetical protein